MKNNAVIAVVVATLLVGQAVSAQSASPPAAKAVLMTNVGRLLSTELPSPASPLSAPWVQGKPAERDGLVTLGTANAWSGNTGANDLIAATQLCEASVAAPNYSPSISLPYFAPSASPQAIADSFWPEEPTSGFEELAAAPEPSTWFGALFAFAFLAWHQRRRFLPEQRTIRTTPANSASRTTL